MIVFYKIRYIMRRILCTSIFFLGTFLYAQDSNSTLQWLTNLEQAKEISKKEKKPILMYMTGSDWCPPCKTLKKDFFESEAFADRAKDMILVMIDYPRAIDILTEEQFEYNKKVVAKYNADKSFPNVLILNSRGKIKDEISGYGSLRDTRPHFAFLDKNNI